MAERSPGALVVRRRLGRSLRELREQANIRIDAAAGELECSPAKISRLENGQGPAKLWDIRILLNFYGVKDANVRFQFENWARNTRAQSWWDADADLASDDMNRYLAAETIAGRIRSFCHPILPALLRTEAYSVSYVKRSYPGLAAKDVRRVVNLQKSRQADVLRGDRDLSCEFIVDESALLRRVGTAKVHEEQLRWLLGLLDDETRIPPGRLNLRILPLDAGPGRSVSPFTIFDSQSPEGDPSSVFVEEATDRGAWLDSVGDFEVAFDELGELSVTQDESLLVLREAIKFSRRPTPWRVSASLDEGIR